MAADFPPFRQRRTVGLTPQPAVTFSRDVAPILWKNCVRCHRPGEVGPFSLLTYQDAAKRASFLYEIDRRRSDATLETAPGRRRLPRRAQAVVARERDAQALGIDRLAPGDPADLPALRLFRDGWQLGEPDLVLTMPEPFDVPADGPDIYQSFPLRVPSDRDLIVAGLEFRPGNRRVVHHSRIHLDAEGDARRRQVRNRAASTRLGSGDPRSVELPYPGLGAWTPGMTPRLAPEGVGRVIPRGSDVVLQIHYHPTGRPERDQSSVGLFLAKKPVDEDDGGLLALHGPDRHSSRSEASQDHSEHAHQGRRPPALGRAPRP